jgi:hypothetical protein
MKAPSWQAKQRHFNGVCCKVLMGWTRWLAAFFVHYRVHKSTLLHSGLNKTTQCLLNALRACKFITRRRFGFSVQMGGAFWIVYDIRVGRPPEYQHSWPVVACQHPSHLTTLCEEDYLRPIRASLIRLLGEAREDVDGPLSSNSSTHRALPSFTGAPIYGIRIS